MLAPHHPVVKGLIQLDLATGVGGQAVGGRLEEVNLQHRRKGVYMLDQICRAEAGREVPGQRQGVRAEAGCEMPAAGAGAHDDSKIQMT